MNITFTYRLIKFFILLLGFTLMPNKSFGQTGSQASVSYAEVDHEPRTITIKSSNHDFSIEYEGEITLSDDDKDIVAISDGGFLEIKKSRFGKKRRIKIEPDGDGLVKKYYIGRTEVDWNPEGKQWLAEILPDLVRRTGIAAKSRVDRFYKQGGATAVLNEIDKLKNDYVRSIYIKLLLQKNLNEDELVSAIQTIKNLDSDYYKASIVNSIIKDTTINDNQMAILLQISKGIDSDYYKNEVLCILMKNREMNAQNVGHVMSLSKDINSDYYSADVITKALKLKNLSYENYDKFLSSMSNLDSDYYVAEVISKSLQEEVSIQNLSRLLDKIVQNVDSDHYSALIYKELSKSNNLQEEHVVEILNSIGTSIDSDHYLTEALGYYSSYVKNGSSKVKEAYKQAAKNIDSETYFGKAMKAVY